MFCVNFYFFIYGLRVSRFPRFILPWAQRFFKLALWGLYLATWYLKIGHYCFLAHPSQFIVHLA
jgi:hypothetical protein